MPPIATSSPPSAASSGSLLSTSGLQLFRSPCVIPALHWTHQAAAAAPFFSPRLALPLTAMQALYRDVGRPASLILCRLWASQRLDLALSLALQAAVPGGMGVALSRVVRLAVAAKIASSVQSHRKPTAVATPDGEDSDGEEEEDSDGRANDAAPPPAGPTAGAPSRGTSRRSHLPAPKGLGLGGGLPRGGGGMILPAVPPGGLACCSVQPIGLPLMLTGQAAARAPMYAMHGDRLVRGLAGLAATLLLCRSAPCNSCFCLPFVAVAACQYVAAIQGGWLEAYTPWAGSPGHS